VTRLHRDRRTWLTYAQLGTYGYFLYGFGPALTLLREDVGFSRTVAGLHGTALAVGALLAALCVAPLSVRFGRTAMIWAGLVLLCLGVAIFTAFTAVPLTLFGSFVTSFGGSFVVTCSSTVLAAVHHESGPAAITEANAVAAGVGAIAPLVVGASVAVSLGWRAAVLVVIPIVAVEAVAGRRAAVVPRPEPAYGGGRAARLSRRYWVSWVVVTAGIGVEFCLALWSADLLQHRTSLSRAAAAASVTALVAGMAVGRTFGGRLALRLPLDRLLVGAVGVNAVGFAVFWLATWPLLAIAGLAVAGLGVALYFPLGLARAIGASEGRPDQASARVGLGAALASGGGPFVLGALADHIGIHAAMLVVPALLVVALAGIRLSPAHQPRVSTG
jgi:predicted MFS family arabinose efflux permease